MIGRRQAASEACRVEAVGVLRRIPGAAHEHLAFVEFACESPLINRVDSVRESVSTRCTGIWVFVVSIKAKILAHPLISRGTISTTSGSRSRGEPVGSRPDDR
jgi:hypothetical protein